MIQDIFICTPYTPPLIFEADVLKFVSLSFVNDQTNYTGAGLYVCVVCACKFKIKNNCRHVLAPKHIKRD